ncbi:hypothetical protein Patl1_05613 [Pistacia atlantica]|uniref:Uncharacterized protein n=1 Tax=Pistacia atlantica TaxID=434234 RepID=A0ACC1BSR2_9ROSI|nr:hypothetical protein Patl1_05613 [Pistacia atlantica]
MKVLICLR